MAHNRIRSQVTFPQNTRTFFVDVLSGYMVDLSEMSSEPSRGICGRRAVASASVELFIPCDVSIGGNSMNTVV